MSDLLADHDLAPERSNDLVLIRTDGGYWRPNCCGYTNDPRDAGRYARDFAERQIKGLGPEKMARLVPLREIPRSPEDFSREFAGYLATSAEHFIDVFASRPEEWTDAARTDALRDLRSSIYEWRKREACAPALPTGPSKERT